MSKIMVVANQKGGVGKTTTTINLAAALANHGKKILVIDMDPQGNATSGFGVDKYAQENTAYELLIGHCDLDDCLLKNVFEGLDLIPSNINLAAAETELVDLEDKEFILDGFVQKIRDQYDYILIDCPPSLNLLTINAMCAGEKVLIPIQCEYYALEGLAQLLQTTSLVAELMNNNLDIDGIVFTMYDGRTNLAFQVVQNVKEQIDVYTYESMIPRNVRLAEAPSYGMPIIAYDPKSSGAESYMSLAEEFLKRNDS